MNYPRHECPRRDRPEMATCGNCHRSWCAACDPAPAALCPWCNGYGYSTAPIPPRQAIELGRRPRRSIDVAAALAARDRGRFARSVSRARQENRP